MNLWERNLHGQEIIQATSVWKHQIFTR